MSFNSVEPPLATDVTTKLDGTEVVMVGQEMLNYGLLLIMEK